MLRVSEKEAIAHIKARIVTANVRRAFALYPKECILSLSPPKSLPTLNPQIEFFFRCTVDYMTRLDNVGDWRVKKGMY